MLEAGRKYIHYTAKCVWMWIQNEQF